MTIELIKLPYGVNDLEPYISGKTMLTHYNKHYLQHVDKINHLISGTTYSKMTLEEIILLTSKKSGNNKTRKIFNNAAQAWNHNFLWSCMTPDTDMKPSEEFLRVLMLNFGSLENFKKMFKHSAINLFGSGWIWLVMNKDGEISIVSTHQANAPIIYDLKPLLCCDVWEHAYYLDYQNDRSLYIDNFIKIINWNFAEQNYQKNFFQLENAFIEGDI
jgi:Fe-Mn family superoxide dismutase